jgi:hypothetical protein
MYRSNRLEVPERLGYGIAFPASNFSFDPYHSTTSTTDGGRHVPPRPEEVTCASVLPPHGYTNTLGGNTPSNLPRSNRLESDFPVLSTNLASGLIGHGQDINGDFNISRGSRSTLPLGNQSVLSSSFGHGLGGFEMTTSFPALENFTSPLNLQSYFAPSQTMLAETRDSHDINSTGILNDDLQMPFSECFFFGQPGWHPSQDFIAESD